MTALAAQIPNYYRTNFPFNPLNVANGTCGYGASILYDGVVGKALFTAAFGGALDAKSSLWVTSYSQEVSITSSNNLPCKLTVYYAMARDDQEEDYKFNDSLNLGFTANGYTNGQTDVNLTPYQSSVFAEQWRIYKVKSFFLREGARNVTLRQSNKRLIRLRYDRDTMGPTNAGILIKRNYSKVLLWRLEGSIQAASDNGTGTTTAPEINQGVKQWVQYKYDTVGEQNHASGNNYRDKDTKGMTDDQNVAEVNS